MRQSLTSFMVVLYSLTTAPFAFTQWTQTSGPYGTDVTSLVASGTVLLAGTREGVYRSTDNGTHWTPANAGLTNTSIRSLAIAGGDFFAGTLNGAFRSTDDGKTWTETGASLPAIPVNGLAASEDYLFAGTTHGVFRSADKGAHWTGVGSNTPTHALAASGTTLFAGTGAGIRRSTDNGASWTMVDPTHNKNTGTYTGQVSFVFDDLLPSHYTALKPIFTAHGVPAVLAVMTANIGMTVNAKQLRELEGYGWEMASHTVFHPHLTTIPADSMGWELRQSQQDLVNIGLKKPSVIVYPYGDQDATVIDSASRYYTTGVLADGWFNGYPVPKMKIKRINGDNSTVLATYQGYIDHAASSGLWLVFMMHEADSASQRILIDELIRYTGSRGLPIVTITQGIINVTSFAVHDMDIIAGAYDGISHSANGGRDWDASNSGLTNTSVLSLTASGGNIFAGTRNGVFLSTDSGTRWTEVSPGLTNRWVSSLAIHGKNLFAGTHYDGVWRRPLSEMVRTEDGVLSIAVRNRSGIWPTGWAGRIRLYGNDGEVVDAAEVDPLDGTAVIRGVDPGDGYFCRIWATPNPPTLFGEEFWGQTGPLTIVPGPEVTSLIFDSNTPSVTAVRVHDLTSGQDVTGDSVTVGTGLRLLVTIANPAGGSPQTLCSRLVLDPDRTLDAFFDSTTAPGTLLQAGDTTAQEFLFTPELPQQYFAAAGSLIESSGQLTLSDGQPWSDSPLVTVVEPENPAPVLSAIVPSVSVAGDSGFILAVMGSRFLGSSVILLDHAERPTIYVSSTELHTEISDADIAEPKEHSILVFTPGPGGGISDSVTLLVSAPHLLEITEGPTGAPNPVAPGGEVSCTVSSYDSHFHTLQFAWSASGGVFSDTTSWSPTWRAPINPPGGAERYVISVTVTCAGGVSRTRSYEQSVEPITGVQRLAGGIPKAAVLSQNYPNPFNPQTTIHFGLPHRKRVTLTVYSALGQKVEDLVDAELEAGYYRVTFGGAQRATGIYLCRMRAGDFVQTRRLVLVR